MPLGEGRDFSVQEGLSQPGPEFLLWWVPFGHFNHWVEDAKLRPGGEFEALPWPVAFYGRIPLGSASWGGEDVLLVIQHHRALSQSSLLVP